MKDRLSMAEILGLTPLRERLRQTRLALRGDPWTPASRFDHTSLRILRPRLALRLWMGQRPGGRRVVVYNLFNRTQTPEAEGWSVRKTTVRDFRGGTLTYDSHNGTDFATPPGTVVVAPAPARVALVVSEFHRGGLKVMLDHGDGLCTTLGHLARALVREGDVVARGAPVALSGASGLNFIGSLLADSPHVHFNVWLGGAPVDPFAAPGEVSLWRTGDDPGPHRGGEERFVPPAGFDETRVAAWIAACRHPGLARELAAVSALDARACRTMFAANYTPTRFVVRIDPYGTPSARTPRLDLPFRAEDYDGVAF